MPSVSAGRRDGVAADPICRGARAARSNFGLAGTRFGATSVWKVCTAVGRVAAPGRTQLRRRLRDRGLRAHHRCPFRGEGLTHHPGGTQHHENAGQREGELGPPRGDLPDHGRDPVARLLRDAASVPTVRLRLDHRSRWNGRGNQRTARPIFAELRQDARAWRAAADPVPSTTFAPPGRPAIRAHPGSSL